MNSIDQYKHSVSSCQTIQIKLVLVSINRFKLKNEHIVHYVYQMHELLWRTDTKCYVEQEAHNQYGQQTTTKHITNCGQILKLVTRFIALCSFLTLI